MHRRLSLFAALRQLCSILYTSTIDSTCPSSCVVAAQQKAAAIHVLSTLIKSVIVINILYSANTTCTTRSSTSGTSSTKEQFLVRIQFLGYEGTVLLDPLSQYYYGSST
jgi:hypothetical protein